MLLVRCHGRRVGAVPGVVGLLATLVHGGAGLAAQAAASSTLPSWVNVDTSSRTIRLRLETTAPPDSGGGAARLNGYRRGEAQLVVPLNWTVRWTWRNADSTRSHSLVVMMEREKLPMEGGRAAFTNAMTRAVTSGLQPGQSDVTTFTAEEAGWFWLLCGVPGHALAGEWVGLRVDPAAKMASVKMK
ncbi:MAG: sulfocyanin-like copper-binding protein [Gemmatimonadales bacterium]